MYTSSISSCQICQDVDPTVAESQGQPQPESSKTTYSEQRFDLRALRPPCDKTKLVFQKSQGQCQSRRASANQGQEKLSVVTPALIFIRKSDSRHDRSWRQARKVLRALGRWWVRCRASKVLPDLHRCCLTGGLLPGWPQPPKLQAWSPKAAGWNMRTAATTDKLSASYVR